MLANELLVRCLSTVSAWMHGKTIWIRSVVLVFDIVSVAAIRSSLSLGACR